MDNEKLLVSLKEAFPNGDPLFLEMMYEEIALYHVKNKDYAAGQVGEVIDPNGNFNRVSKFFSMYPKLTISDPRVVCLTYIMKQLDQVAWSLSRGFEGEIEGLDTRLQDIAVYTNILKVLNARIKETKITYAGTKEPASFIPWEIDASLVV